MHTWIEVDSAKLRHNITTIKTRILPPGTALGLVVKGNAYGHGQELITRYCQEQDLIDYFCVAYAAEAIQLRSNGITKPILIMCTIDTDIDMLINNEIDITVPDHHMLDRVLSCAKKSSKKARIHLKFDTGLSRFGFFPEECASIIQKIQHNPHIILCGIYSHFAESCSSNKVTTEKQIAAFKDAIAQFHAVQIKPLYIHQQNSAGTITQQNSFYNMVRVGALAYGLWPSSYTKESCVSANSIRQVLSLKSKIINIKHIPTQSRVGYGGTFTTTRPTRIALLPIGYTDGYMQSYHTKKNNGYVYLHNQYVPIIGYICMNIITIDITDIPNASLNDTVTLIGDRDHLHTSDFAHKLSPNNPRAVTVQLNPLIPRVLV